MEYIIISLVTISLSTLLAYKVANSFLEIRLRLRPLVLCAACAVFISMVLPRIVVGYTSLLGTMAVLVLFIIIFAYFIAYYDSNDDESDKNGLTRSEVSNETQDIIHQDNFTSQAASNVDVGAHCGEIDDVQSEQTGLCYSSVSNGNRRTPPANYNGVSDTGYGDVSIKTLLDNCCVLDNAAQESLAAPVACTTVNIKEISNVSEKIKSNYIADTIELGSVNTEMEKIETINENIIAKLIYEDAEALETLAIEEEVDLSEFKCLDALLDEAFVQKGLGNTYKAFRLFQYALKNYPDSEAAPFIVVELGGFLKSRGYYDQAIQVFVDGRKLTSLHNDMPIEQEFTQTIAHLRIVRNNLVKHQLGFIPYEKIPQEIINEIDSEFREWRTQI